MEEGEGIDSEGNGRPELAVAPDDIEPTEDEIREHSSAMEDWGKGEQGQDEDICSPCDDGQAQMPKGIKGPVNPTAAEVDLHNLTHIPYRSWCPHCIACRKPNTPNFSSRSEKNIPLLVADYCFIRDSADQDLATVLVVRVYPHRMTLATCVDAKGRDEKAINRVASFIKSCGLTQFAYRCDQESAIGALLDEAILLSGRTAVGSDDPNVVIAPPEKSSVGESQSNGKAERSVQQIEDHTRTLKSALETRLNRKIPSTHPVLRWIVEYAAALWSKYHVGQDGMTAYQRLHGKRVQERLVEFGERVLYVAPRKSEPNSTAVLKWVSFLAEPYGI